MRIVETALGLASFFSPKTVIFAVRSLALDPS
jgi:hypothetical protein